MVPHRSRAYLAALLACVLFASLALPAFGVTQSDLEKTQQKAAEARAAAKKAQALADDLAKQTAALDDKIDTLEGQVNELGHQIV